jgi:hypothetical protein
MRSILIAAAIAAGPAFAASEMVARQGDDSIRISEAKCETASVLRHIKPELRKNFRKADARIGGQRYFACWMLQASTVFVVYEDGDLGLVPLQEFKQPNSI